MIFIGTTARTCKFGLICQVIEYLFFFSCALFASFSEFTLSSQGTTSSIFSQWLLWKYVLIIQTRSSQCINSVMHMLHVQTPGVANTTLRSSFSTRHVRLLDQALLWQRYLAILNWAFKEKNGNVEECFKYRECGLSPRNYFPRVYRKKNPPHSQLYSYSSLSRITTLSVIYELYTTCHFNFNLTSLWVGYGFLEWSSLLAKVNSLTDQ